MLLCFLPVFNKNKKAPLKERLGMGRALFEEAKRFARSRGAKKLYISAHSAVESQAFYAAMGCVDACMIQEEHAQREPYDRQMECML